MNRVHSDFAAAKVPAATSAMPGFSHRLSVRLRPYHLVAREIILISARAARADCSLSRISPVVPGITALADFRFEAVTARR
jgi:hypothetical protein